MNVKVLDSSNFYDAIKNSDKTALVDFYADWCGPCKMMAPTLEKLALENSDIVNVFKINIDKNPQIALDFSVISIPTVISFKNGEVYKRSVGNQPKEALLALI